MATRLAPMGRSVQLLNPSMWPRAHHLHLHLLLVPLHKHRPQFQFPAFQFELASDKSQGEGERRRRSLQTAGDPSQAPPPPLLAPFVPDLAPLAYIRTDQPVVLRSNLRAEVPGKEEALLFGKSLRLQPKRWSGSTSTRSW